MNAALSWLGQPRNQAHIHLAVTGVWVCLIPPTLLFWPESVLWVALMSIWANVVGHLSAWQAARGEQRQEARE